MSSHTMTIRCPPGGGGAIESVDVADTASPLARGLRNARASVWRGPDG
jgi:hypothetical protein